MPLLALPDEVLGAILLCLEWDKPALCAMTLQCRRMGRLVPSYLFRNLDISTAQQLALFERSLEENPVLRRHVRVCAVSCPDAEADRGPEVPARKRYMTLNSKANLEDRAPKDLSRFPNIREFRGHHPTRPLPPPSIPKHFLRRRVDFDNIFQVNFVDNLRNANISIVYLSGEFTMLELWAFIFLDGVRTLRGPELHSMECDPNALESFPWTRSSTIEDLELTAGGDYWGLAHRVLRMLLMAMPALKRLRLTLPGNQSTARDTYCQLEEAFSGTDTAHDLEPLKHTLEVLELCADHQDWVHGRGTSLFDLSGFTKIWKLEVSSICFFQDGGPCTDRYELCEQLPINVRDLTIHFLPSAGVLHGGAPNVWQAPDRCGWRAREYDRTGSMGWSKYEGPKLLPEGDLDWFYHFALSLPTRLPKLRRIVLREVVAEKLLQDFRIVSWKAPPELLDIFGRSGAELKVRLRERLVSEVDANKET